jgi:hypothetical protein
MIKQVDTGSVEEGDSQFAFIAATRDPEKTPSHP